MRDPVQAAPRTALSPAETPRHLRQVYKEQQDSSGAGDRSPGVGPRHNDATALWPLPEDGFFVTQMCPDWCGSVQAAPTSFCSGVGPPRALPTTGVALHSDLKDRQQLCHQPPGLPTATLHPGQQLPTLHSYFQPDPYSPVLSSHHKKRPTAP